MAEYQLALFTHWSSCIKCQSNEDCETVQSLNVPPQYPMHLADKDSAEDLEDDNDDSNSESSQ
jgi:hypothetical protein